MYLYCFVFQEIEPKVGEELCRLFPVDENINLISILRKMKGSKQQPKSGNAPGGAHQREDRDHRTAQHRRAQHASVRRSSPDSMRLAPLPTHWHKLSPFVGLLPKFLPLRVGLLPKELVLLSHNGLSIKKSGLFLSGGWNVGGVLTKMCQIEEPSHKDVSWKWWLFLWKVDSTAL